MICWDSVLYTTRIQLEGEITQRHGAGVAQANFQRLSIRF